MTYQELIEYVESLGYTKESNRMTFDNNGFMDDCFWYTVDGMSNYAMKIERKSVTIWTHPYIGLDNLEDTLVCCYSENRVYSLTSKNDNLIKNTLKKLMYDTLKTLREFKK